MTSLDRPLKLPNYELRTVNYELQCYISALSATTGSSFAALLAG
jgi:hypothetical protein